MNPAPRTRNPKPETAQQAGESGGARTPRDRLSPSFVSKDLKHEIRNPKPQAGESGGARRLSQSFVLRDPTVPRPNETRNPKPETQNRTAGEREWRGTKAVTVVRVERPIVEAAAGQHRALHPGLRYLSQRKCLHIFSAKINSTTNPSTYPLL